MSSPEGQGAPVVVTGASGFLGSAVVEELACRGRPVLAVSRRAAIAPKGVEAVQVIDYAETPAPEGARLIHLAEESDVATANSQRDAHLGAVAASLDALLAKEFRRVVYVSSAKVLGEGQGAYVAGKKAAEKKVLDAGGAVARLATVYGPGMKGGTLVRDILDQVPGIGPVRLRNAESKVDLLWVDDAARGLVDLAVSDQAGIFGFGSGKTVTARAIAVMMLGMAGKGNQEIVSLSGGMDGDEPLPLATTTETLGWAPQVPLSEGLGQMMDNKE